MEYEPRYGYLFYALGQCLFAIEPTKAFDLLTGKNIDDPVTFTRKVSEHF